MTGHEDDGDWLRERLDRELGGLTPRPDALREVLSGAQPVERRRPAGPPLWSLAAAAVLVVALAVPVLKGTVFDDPGPRDSVAASVLPPLVPVAPAVSPTPAPTPTVTARPTAAPSPTRSARVVVPPATRRPSPTRAAGPSATPAACPAVGPAFSSATAADLDGDGRFDGIAAVGGDLAVAVGGVATTPLLPGKHAVLPVEADGRPGSELLVLTSGEDGAGAVLYAATRCTVGPVLNAQGDPYTFVVDSKGDTVRHGVACGDGQLYGVTSTRAPDGSWTVTRTPVSSASGRAVNGTPRTATQAADDPDVADLGGATCGTLGPVPLD